MNAIILHMVSGWDRVRMGLYYTLLTSIMVILYG